MLELTIPGLGDKVWHHLLLDVNGTLALDGQLIEGVAERVQALAEQLQVSLVTANAHGTAPALARALGVGYVQVSPGQEAQQKEALVMSLGREQVIAIGNGLNDTLMLSAASLGIAVLGPEGTAAKAIQAADLLAPSIQIALDLLINPARLSATLRC